MKQFLAIILFLPIVSVNVALAESHLSKDAEQAEKFEKAVKFVSDKKICRSSGRI